MDFLKALWLQHPRPTLKWALDKMGFHPSGPSRPFLRILTWSNFYMRRFGSKNVQIVFFVLLWPIQRVKPIEKNHTYWYCNFFIANYFLWSSSRCLHYNLGLGHAETHCSFYNRFIATITCTMYLCTRLGESLTSLGETENKHFWKKRANSKVCRYVWGLENNRPPILCPDWLAIVPFWALIGWPFSHSPPWLVGRFPILCPD